MNAEIDYFFERARQEVLSALRATHPKAAEAHTDLSIRYVNRARMLLKVSRG